ncbi:uncharacterized protein LOC21399738 [Morus notabilis]|uniref:uncharacterized protein LOC21399738 n=1 Tax=Morus notabilis TaxID=981085 RepID=UPI000CED1605|nr:uncharacterized protein LOC21399738 [Morus notabilis]
MAKSHLGLLSLFVFLTISTVAVKRVSCSDDNSTTVYDILPKFGLPSGLLPDSVVNYTLSPNDGRFVVVLENPCYINFEYLVYYDKTITGKLGYGSITELKGIEVRRFLIWFDVDEIKVDLPPSNSIYFQVGFINKKLDLDQFKVVRACYYGSPFSPCALRKQFLQLPNPTEELEMLITE